MPVGENTIASSANMDSAVLVLACLVGGNVSCSTREAAWYARVRLALRVSVPATW